MKSPFTLSKAQSRTYDIATRKLRRHLGAFDTMAVRYFTRTNILISGQSLRTWFRNRSIPVEQAAILVELADCDVQLADLFPWLPQYLQENRNA